MIDMSLSKKVKDRLASPKARISLQLSRNDFVLGESAEATLAVSSDEDFDAKEIRAEIQCVEKARRVQYECDSMAKRNVPREVQESKTLYFAKPPATVLTHITQGFSQTFPLRMIILATGTPTFQRIDTRVSWLVKGVVAIDGRPDIASQPTEIQVFPPSAQPTTEEKEVIREVVVIKTLCKNCGALMPETDTFCQNCGAKRT